MLRIQVKGKQGKVWPGCKGIYGEDIFLIFVDFKKRENERPDFYILTVQDWEALLKKEVTNKFTNEQVTIDKATNTPIWPDGFKGMAIEPTMLENYRERWDKITGRLDC